MKVAPRKSASFLFLSSSPGLQASLPLPISISINVQGTSTYWFRRVWGPRTNLLCFPERSHMDVVFVKHFQGLGRRWVGTGPFPCEGYIQGELVRVNLRSG